MGYKAAPWTKFWIFSAFTVAGIVAGLAGPSSAILMIPRNQTWSTATWEYYLTGTTNDLWPAVLQQQHTGGSDCNSPNATDNAFCVSGGYSALFHHFSVFTQMPQSNAFTIDVEDKATKQTLKGNIRNNWQPDSETWTQAPHAATTVLEEPLREVWSFNLRYTSGNLVYSSIRTVRSETRFPVVRTVCVPLQNISASVSSLPFPVLPEYDFWHVPSVASGYYGNGPVASLELSQSAGQIWNSSASRVPLSARAKWISLPAEFGSITSGLIIAIPPEPGQSNALAITCSVDSRWAKGESWLTSSQEDWAWAGFYGPMQSNPLRTRSGYNDYGGARLFLPIDDGSWSRIAADEAWLDALTPQLSTSSGTASTTLESTLANSIPNVVNINSIDDVFSNTSSILIPFVEHVISTTMADGISRVGSALQMNTSNLIKKLTSVPTAQIRLSRKPLDPPSGPFTKMQMRTEVQGYSYSTSGFTVWLALTVLFLHCLIAAGYTLLVVGWTGKTSSCWDSVSELLALVQNSPPAPCVLRNTSAGIKELSTFAHTAKLVVAKDQDNVELVYLSDGHLNDSGLGGVVPGKAYGHSP